MDDLTVTVRMYRRLLGDCFMIILASGEKKSSILIDFGILQGTPDAASRMKAVADDIFKVSGGKLDLVIATHEHADHLSGFGFAREMFFDNPQNAHVPQIEIANLWLAWTEKSDDEQAKALLQRFDKRRDVVRRLAAGVAAAEEGTPFAMAPSLALDGLTGFLEIDETAFGVAGAGRLTIRETFDKLKAAALNTVHLEPGDAVQTPVIPLKTFVLAPPRDEKLLFKDLPSKGSDAETYLDPRDGEGGASVRQSALALNEPLLLHALGLSESYIDEAGGGETKSRSPSDHSPFSPSDRKIEIAEVRGIGKTTKRAASASIVETQRWCRERYFGTAKDTKAVASEKLRRRIDGDWLAAAGEFALKLDSDTNNSSLVLAFELPDKTFMLFAADAQVGNWLSWHNQKYADGDLELSAKDILNRVRFYKVGHHGSHNATMDKQGLAMMSRNDLVAMVSTDETFALKQGRGGGWLMPNPRVKAALLAATKGRLVRGDRKWSEDEDVRSYPISPEFKKRLDETAENDLYVDYRIFG